MRVSSRSEWRQQSRLLDQRDKLTRLLAELREAATSRLGYEAHGVTDDEAAIQADVIESRLTATNEALARIDAGVYGICQACRAPIPDERLETLPAAALCVPCAG